MNSLLVVVVLVMRGTGSAHADTPTANSSARRTFPCSVKEKECFQYNQLLYKGDGKCYRIGSRGPCSEDRVFVALKDIYTRNGRLFGVCQPLLRCDDPNKILMADGSCQPTGGKIFKCPYDETMQSKKNIFGEWECCLPDKCDEVSPDVEQPEDEEYCVTPNLTNEQREERLRNSNYSLLGGQLECSDSRDFYAKTLVRLLRDCRKGLYVVDKDKFLQKNIIAVTCKAPLCDLGLLYMAKEVHGNIGCLSIADIYTKLCMKDGVVFNAFGEALCGGAVSQESLLSLPEARAEDCVPPETEEARPAPTSDIKPFCRFPLPCCPARSCPPCGVYNCDGGLAYPRSRPFLGENNAGRGQPPACVTEAPVE